ncbi:hypothetical protein B0H17DRAFT_1143313 [Mycena rosella]|uniref:Uncharacterized protein n=1 Tax=Mycena rosella TaxID=1033263 RepID=A0AAD7CVU0_MYCRO|nr:hypothetical protein B0H17DRAFT_1143313 [Mycena rosella]
MLSEADQVIDMRAWETIGAWKVGITKLSIMEMKTEKSLRAKVCKELLKVWKQSKPVNNADVVQEVQRQKAMRLELQRARETVRAKKEEEKARKKQKGKRLQHIGMVLHEQGIERLDLSDSVSPDDHQRCLWGPVTCRTMAIMMARYSSPHNRAARILLP